MRGVKNPGSGVVIASRSYLNGDARASIAEHGRHLAVPGLCDLRATLPQQDGKIPKQNRS
ncbi:hypothetical protein GCM10009662_57120 [Catellatospora coxensis]